MYRVGILISHSCSVTNTYGQECMQLIIIHSLRHFNKLLACTSYHKIGDFMLNILNRHFYVYLSILSNIWGACFGYTTDSRLNYDEYINIMELEGILSWTSHSRIKAWIYEIKSWIKTHQPHELQFLFTKKIMKIS